MQANVGDEIIIVGHEVGRPQRSGEVLEVRGDDGGPPYVVRWDDTGRTTILYPGSDAHIKHLVRHQCGSPADLASC
ncbi:MAG: DUF1918 domain-containing protein [Actinomycetota bacterium]